MLVNSSVASTIHNMPRMLAGSVSKRPAIGFNAYNPAEMDSASITSTRHRPPFSHRDRWLTMRRQPAGREMEGSANKLDITHRVTYVGAAVNVLLSIVKLIVGVLAHSHALIADGLHSLSDLVSDGLVLISSSLAHRSPDTDHPYGHQRFETLGTLLLGGLLMAVAGALAFDNVARLIQDSDIGRPGRIALVVALLAVASKEWLYHYTVHAARRIRSELLKANAWHHRSDALSSVVVFVGIGGALLGFPRLDSVGAVIVAAMIAQIGWSLLWDSTRELVDTALPDDEVAAMRAIAESVEGVREVHSLRTRRMGGGTVLDIHIQVDPGISVSEGHQIGVWVARRLRERFDHINDVTFHVDPEDDSEINPATEAAPPLPLRSEILTQLQQTWHGHPAYDQAERIVLHYVGQRVDVELFLPTSTTADDSAAAHSLVTRGPTWLRRLRLWRRYGQEQRPR